MAVQLPDGEDINEWIAVNSESSRIVYIMWHLGIYTKTEVCNTPPGSTAF